MSAPVVSVVIPSYNGEALIGETLASLSCQTLRDFEVLVVDDCSTDATRDVVRGFGDARVRLIEQARNGGPVRARNAAVAQVRGRYLAALDQDDLCHPERLAVQVAFLEANPHVVLAGSAADFLSERGAIRRPAVEPTSPVSIGWQLRVGNPLVWSSVMMRTDAARRLDPFSRNERLYAEDFDLYHRIGRYGAVARIDRALVTYRQHRGGLSKRHVEAMLASARRVLSTANADVLGAEADAAADLFAHHLMDGEPVTDGDTLFVLSAMMVRLRDAYLAMTPHEAADRALIDRAMERSWSGVLRAGLRSGNLTPGQIAAAGTVMPVARPASLAWSGLIGRLRRAGRLHTFAA